MRIIDSDKTRFFVSCDIAAENKNSFISKMEQLVQDTPSYVWVDNNHKLFRHWEYSCLYTANNSITFNAYFTMKGYTLLIDADATIIDKGSTLLLNGVFHFSYENFQYTGTSLELTNSGIFSFQTIITSADDLDMGIRYFTDGYCTITKRTTCLSVRSPIITVATPEKISVQYSPHNKDLCGVSFLEPKPLQSCFTSIYGDPAELTFTGNRHFVFQDKYSITKGHQYYLSPSGSAELHIRNNKNDIVMPGLSGSEYIRLLTPNITFTGDNPAYFEKQPYPCTTSYIAFNNAHYYSQPEKAAYYTQTQNNIYGFAELVPVKLDTISLPVFPHYNADNATGKAEHIERMHLTPLRQSLIEEAYTSKNLCAAMSNSDIVAISRNGMKICIDRQHTKTQWIRIATDNNTDPGMAFTYPDPQLVIGLEAANLFMVMDTNEHAHTPYTISKNNLDRSMKKGYRDADKLTELIGSVYYTYKEFADALTQKNATTDQIIHDACDNWNITVSDWHFTASPEYWKEFNSILVTKLTTDMSLLELVQHPSLWSLPPKDTSNAAKCINTVAERAKELHDTVLNKILKDKHWRGTVLFNCGVDVTSLPAELAFLANGINPKDFKALYLAFPASTANNNASICALIDYNDPTHQYFSSLVKYSFKVLSLQMNIVNNCIVNFQSTTELLINSLYGGRTKALDTQAGNNIVFNGTYQQNEDDGGHYTFLLKTPVTFTISGSGAEFMTVTHGTLKSDTTSSKFVLDGDLALYHMKEFDFFSYSKLLYSGFTVEMQPSGSSYKFSTALDTMSLTTEGSITRENSLAARFPIQVTTIRKNTDKSPEQLGYTALQIKGIAPEKMDDPYYALMWQVRLGNLGELASKLNVTLDIISAWSPRPEMETNTSYGAYNNALPKIFTGIRCGAAGSTDDWHLPLQGIATLGFDSIDIAKDAEYNYSFRFRNFSLTILGMRFPPINNDMYLVSNKKHVLGWYGSASQ